MNWFMSFSQISCLAPDKQSPRRIGEGFTILI